MFAYKFFGVFFFWSCMQAMRIETPLHCAAQKGDIVAVRNLLSHGADINAKDKNFQTSLYRGVLYGRYEVVRLLLKAGADPNIWAMHFEEGHNYDDLLYCRSIFDNGNYYHFPDIGKCRTALALSLRSRSKNKEKIAKLLLFYGATGEGGPWYYTAQKVVGNCEYGWPVIKEKFPQSILNGQAQGFDDDNCLGNIDAMSTKATLNQGMACAAARGRTDLLRSLKVRADTDPSFINTEFKYEKIFSRIFAIAALRGQESTVKFLLPFACDKEIHFAYKTIKNLTRHATLSGEEQTAYREILNTLTPVLGDRFKKLLP